jgi:hypothetical protein
MTNESRSQAPAIVTAVLLLIAGASGLARPAVAADPVAPVIAGVTLPGRIDIEKTSLVLNGVALRRIALVKIYVAGLYLPERKQQPEVILAAGEPRSLVMHFLRDVEAKRLCEGWDSSLENNTPNPSAKLRQQFETLCGWMETAREGERLSFVYVPGRGTSVETRAKPRSSTPQSRKKKIRPVVSRVMPLAEVARAHQILYDRGVTGRIVLTA